MFGFLFALSLALVSDFTSSPSPAVEASETVEEATDSLFGNASPAPDTYTLPAYAVDSDGNMIVNEVSPSPSPASDAVESVSADIFEYVTYSDVEEIVATALEATTASSIDIANAYLSSSIVDCFSRVVAGLPVGTHYVAYRNNTTDSNEGYLLFGKSGKYNGDSLVFSSGTLVHYYRYQISSGNYYSYDYRYTVEDVSDYSISLNNQSLVYTDLVDGYPTLSTGSDADRNVSFALVYGCVLLAVFLIFRKK